MKTFVTATVLLLLASFIFKSINLPIIVLSIYFIYTASERFLDVTLFDTKFYKLLVSFFIYTLLLGALVASTTLIIPSFPLSLYPVALLVIVGLPQIINKVVNKNASKKQSMASKNIKNYNLLDGLAIIISVLVIAVTILPPYIHSGFSKKNVISAVYGGVDDTVHLALINDRVQFDKGVFLDKSLNVRASDKTSYPAAWHSANAAIVQSLLPAKQSGLTHLVAYIGLKVVWYGVMLFLIARLAFKILRHYLKASNRVAYATMPIALLITGTLGITQFFYGFFGFFPQIIALILLTSLLLQLLEKPLLRSETLVLLCILAMVGGTTWILLLPALGLSIAGAMLFARPSVLYWVGILKVSFVKYWVLYCLSLLTVIQTLWLAGFSEESVSFMNDIVLGGGVAVYTLWFYLLLLVGVVSFFYRNSKAKNAITKLFVIISILLLVTALSILTLQLISVGEPRYYFYKTMTALCLVVAPICIAGFGALITKYATRPSVTILLSCLTIVVAGVLIGKQPSKTTDLASYLNGIRPYSTQIRDDVYTALKNSSSEQYGKQSYRFYVNNTNQMESFYTTMLAKSEQPGSTCFFEVRKTIVQSLAIDQVVRNAVTNCKSETVTIVTPESNRILVANMAIPKSISFQYY